MRALLYIGDPEWSASARVFLAVARGLAARGHQAVLALPRGGSVVERVAGQGVETVLYEPGINAASATWELRRVFQDLFVEVAFVHTEAEQLRVSSAMRLAERGAVIRRIPAFTAGDDRLDSLALRFASAGLLFTTEVERASVDAKAWPIRPAVAPLGIDAAAHDAITPAARAELRVAADAMLIGCPFDPTGRFQLATVMRSIARLSMRHPELHALVFGPGSMHDDLRMHAAALGVAARVTFLGNVPDPVAILGACDLAWITAKGDAGAYGCLDAMALRLPVVAERSALSQHYVADGLTGLLLRPDDPAQVASAVATILAHKKARETMGGAGRSRVQREFTDKAMLDAFEAAGVAAGDRTKWAVR